MVGDLLGHVQSENVFLIPHAFLIPYSHYNHSEYVFVMGITKSISFE